MQLETTSVCMYFLYLTVVVFQACIFYI